MPIYKYIKYLCVYGNAHVLSTLTANFSHASQPRLAMKRGKGKREKHFLYSPENNAACPAFPPFVADRLKAQMPS